MANGDEHLSDDIDQLFELTRIIVLVISSYVPNLSPHHPVREELPEHVVSLIVLALDALVDVAAVFPIVIRSDLHACILHIFSSILSSATCQESLVPNALPIFRRFLMVMAKDPQHDTYGQVRSALARLVTILKTAQRREHTSSLACEKNTLLAITILLTSSSSVFPPQDPLLTRVIDEMIDCLTNRMTTKVIAGLSRSLLLLPYQIREGRSEAGTSSTISAHVLPLLVDFVINPSDVEETDQARSIIASALTSFAINAPAQSQKLVACNIVTSTLLRRASIEGNDIWAETAARFIDMGGAMPAIFRAVVAQLSTEQRSLLEEIVRAGAGAGKARKDVQELEAKEPTIALKLDF